MLGNLPDIFRAAHFEKNQVHNIDKKSFDQQGHDSAHKEGIDTFPGDVADVIAAYITTHYGIDDQDKVRHTAKQYTAEQVNLLKNKGKQVKMKDWEKKYQDNTFMKAALDADFKKIKGPLQSKELRWNILALALNDIKLLDLRNGIQQIFGPYNMTWSCSNNLGIGFAFTSAFSSTSHWLLPLLLTFYKRSNFDKVSQQSRLGMLHLGYRTK